MVSVAHAQVTAAKFGAVLNPVISSVVNPLVELAFAVALVVFVYGVIQMIIHETDSEEHAKGRLSMLYGVIGMVIMVSAWGIINIVANTVKQF